MAGWGDIRTGNIQAYNKRLPINRSASEMVGWQARPGGISPGFAGSSNRTTSDYRPPVQQQQQQQQQQITPTPWQPKPFDMGNFMGQFQIPGMPNASAQQIADWLARAKTEAGLQFDPQLLGIRQALESALLGSQEARGGINPAYEGAVGNIQDWLTQNLGEEQRRWYSRGLGRGGGLIESERKLTETATKGMTNIEQERARVITDIEKQESLLKKQAGEKEAGVATARGQFISSRSSDLRDRWESQKAQLDQQAFQNQMSIAQFGLTAESQQFNQQIEQAKFNADTAYRDELMNLEKASMNLGQGMEAADPYANMIKDPTTGLMITYDQYLKGQGAKGVEEVEPTQTVAERKITDASDKVAWDEYLAAFYPNYESFKKTNVPNTDIWGNITR